MPPPTAGDAWLAARRFGVVIDAGSSGSRLQIYSWKDSRSVKIEKGSDIAYTLPKVEKGTRHGDDWVKKVEPGISSFSRNPQDVSGYLRPLLDHAMSHIPPSLQPETPLFLLATAGMRLLTPEDQAQVLEEACHFLSRHSNFKIDPPSDKGPCGSSVRIISGEEEGLFGWIAVNYLTDGFSGPQGQGTTYGFLDMGGASTQIAFEPSPEQQGDARNLMDVRLRLLGGDEVKHSVFVTTWLGYGTNQARERYVGKAILDHEKARHEGTADDDDVVHDPCLPKGLELVEHPLHMTPKEDHPNKAHRLVGTGSFEQCMRDTAPLLNKDAPCPDTPCLMNGIYVPPINFSVSHFIGVSEYWYSSEHIFGLGGAYDFVQYERAATDYCARHWEDLLEQHKEMKALHHLGGDGEVLEGGKVVQAGKWNSKVEISRLEMQCFKAAWVVNVLHEGLGLPRIVDPGGNVSGGASDVIAKANMKGLGRPAFQSLDSVGDIAISWTLGKMVLEASKEVTPASKTAKPLVDPIDDIPNIEDSPFQPIRPHFLSLQGLEDRISPHLPSSLTRSALGFSPVLFLFCLCIFCLVIIGYPLRRQLRGLCRNLCLRCLHRAAAKREEQNSLMEEGKSMNGVSLNSRPPSPTANGKAWLSTLRRIFWKAPPTVLAVFMDRISYKNGHSSPNHSHGIPLIAAAKSTHYSRAPSPIHIPDSLTDFGCAAGSPSTLLSVRSRNGSAMSLSIISPRTPMSRTNSLMQISNNTPHQDE